MDDDLVDVMDFSKGDWRAVMWDHTNPLVF
jgi:hypothetical protein